MPQTLQPKTLQPPASPGELILEVAAEQSLSLLDIAKRSGIASAKLSEVVRGNEPITLEIARKLQAVLGPPARFWIAAQEAFDQQRVDERSEDAKELSA